MYVFFPLNHATLSLSLSLCRVYVFNVQTTLCKYCIYNLLSCSLEGPNWIELYTYEQSWNTIDI